MSREEADERHQELLDTLHRIELGLGRVQTRVEETAKETQERVSDVQQDVKENRLLVSRGLRRLESTWNRSPYLVIVLLCGGAFFLFLVVNGFR